MSTLVSKETLTVKPMRESNLELLRIIAMFSIVAHHYVANSGLTSVIIASPISFNSIFFILFSIWGKTAINCFLMITGYFMCQSTITFKKFAKLILQVLFYNLVINAIFWITGYQPFSWETLLNLLPITSISDGFVSTFLVFFLFIPFLNLLIQKMNEIQHIALLVLCFIVYVVFGTLHQITFNYVSWFMVIYLVASYIRLYPKKLFSKKNLWGFLLLGFVVLASFVAIACQYVSLHWFTISPFAFLTDSNSLFPFIIAICAFLFFKNLNIKPNKTINLIASATFGVLLIHANSASMRRFLWVDLFKCVELYNSTLAPLHAIGVIVAIFIVAALIDLGRQYVLEKPLFVKMGPLCDSIQAKVVAFETKISEKLKTK